MKTLAREQDLTAIRQRIAALTPADARVWGTMTVEQMMGHVRGAYAAALGELEVAPYKLPLPGQLVKWFSLTLPARWPQGVPTVPELTVRQMPAPAAFADEKASLEQALEQFVTAGAIHRNHPMFGRMTPHDWMRWGYLHADHHLRQFGR